MKRFHHNDDEPFSPTSWERDPYESDEDYEERIQDQEDYLESFDD